MDLKPLIADARGLSARTGQPTLNEPPTLRFTCA
jgi:hypothetical protein